MTSGGPQQGWPDQPHPDHAQPAAGQGQPPPDWRSGQSGQQYPGQQPQHQQPGQPIPPPQNDQQPPQPGQQYPQQPGQYPGPSPYQQGPPSGRQYPQGPQQPPPYQQPGQHYPGEQPPYQQGQYQQPQYGQAPYQQPQYQQPQYQQTPYQQPQAGSQYPQQVYGQPAGGPGTPMDQPPGGSRSRKNLPVIVTVIAVVVALVAAGLVYLFAFKGSNTASGGKSTPKAAVVDLLSSVNDSDPIGIADQLDPSEAQLFADVTGDVLDQLKRLGVIRQDVAADNLTGVTISTQDLTYAESPIVLNDHLQIVELTGGTLTVTVGSGTNPLTKKMRDALPDMQMPEQHTQTVDIAKQVSDLGHPIRIATVKRDGKWYPSLFYTIADNWAYETKGAGYKLTPIGDNGGSTPQDAMNTFIQAIENQDPKALISVLSPGGMAVLHDYGNLMIGAQPDLGDTPLGEAQVSNLSWSVSDVTGGKKVSLKTMTITTPQGDISIVRDPAAQSLKVSIPGRGTIDVSADSLASRMNEVMGPAASEIPPQVLDIVKREFGKVIGLGVVMVQAPDGKWYVSPLRTFSDVLVSLLSGLNSGDIDYFLSLRK